jgi:succinoglycan biosynthesis protein ExoA
MRTEGGVLVVIPTLNEAAHIQTVLNDLIKESPWLPNMRIVVADGGSTDDTVAIVNQAAQRHRQIALLHNPARIQSAAVNLAVRRYGQDADVLIRCDAHAVYPSDYCRRLVESLDRVAALGEAGADAVVVPMDSIGKTCFQRAVAWVSNSPLGTGGAAHRAGRRSGFVDHGHHAAFRMDRFRRTGGYDETFSHNEDAEFDCRQRALGARIYLDTSIRVQYRPRGSARSLWRQYFQYGSGRSRTVRKHPGSLRLRQLAVPSHLVLSALALLVSRWWVWSLAWPGFYAAALLGMSAQLTIRHRSVCGLLAGPAAAVMHTAWACGFLLGLVTRRERRWRPTMVTPLTPLWAGRAGAGS